MSIYDQRTEPIKVRPHLSSSPDYGWLKQLADSSGVRLLHVYRLSQGQRVQGVDTTRLVQALSTFGVRERM